MAGTDGNRVISGIADGRVEQGSNEAINGGQLHLVVQQLENQNESRYNALNSRIKHNRKVASQGIASAMAMQIDMGAVLDN